jgi:hypothetical protein
MGIEKEGEIVEDDPELGKETFGESEVPEFVAFNDDIQIVFSPNEKNRDSDKKDNPDCIEKRLFLLRVEGKVLKEVEFIESDKKGEDGYVFLGKETKEIA